MNKRSNYRIMSNGHTYWIERRFLLTWWTLDSDMSIWGFEAYQYNSIPQAEQALEHYLS